MAAHFYLLALPSVLGLHVAVPLWRTAAVRVPATLATASDTTPASVDQLEAWTREYYGAARDSRVRGGQSMDEFLNDYNWFADEYVLTGPDIGPLCRSDYLATQRGFTLDFGAAAPDLDYKLDGFHLDPENPERVWFTLRYVGTNTGATSLGKLPLPATGNPILGGPEMHSIWWTPSKQIKWETVGYSGCKFTGTNEGYGGLAGLLLPLGVPRAAFDFTSPFTKLFIGLSRFNEASETGGRACSPDSDLPTWWKQRTELGVNIRR